MQSFASQLIGGMEYLYGRPEDFMFAERVLSIVISKYGIEFSWKDVMKILEKNPELRRINENRVNPKF